MEVPGNPPAIEVGEPLVALNIVAALEGASADVGTAGTASDHTIGAARCQLVGTYRRDRSRRPSQKVV